MVLSAHPYSHTHVHTVYCMYGQLRIRHVTIAISHKTNICIARVFSLVYFNNNERQFDVTDDVCTGMHPGMFSFSGAADGISFVESWQDLPYF